MKDKLIKMLNNFVDKNFSLPEAIMFIISLVGIFHIINLFLPYTRIIGAILFLFIALYGFLRNKKRRKRKINK